MKSKFFVIVAIVALAGFAVILDNGNVCAQQEAPTKEQLEEGKYVIPVEFSNFLDKEAEMGTGGWGLNGFDPQQVIYTEPPDGPGGPNPNNTFDFGDEADVDALANGGDALFHALLANRANLLVSFEFEGVTVVIHDDPTDPVVKDTNECEEWVYADACILQGQYVSQPGHGVWLRGIWGEPYGSATYTSTIACRAIYVQYRSSDYNDGITDIFVDDMVNPLVRIDTYKRGDWYVEIRGLSNTTHTVKVGPSHNSDWTNVIPSPHGQACDPEGDHPDCDNWFWYFCFGPSDPVSGTSVYMEDYAHPAAYQGPKWSQVELVNDANTVDELDGLEVWGPYGSDDANYYSLVGDPDLGMGRVSVYSMTAGAYITQPVIVAAVNEVGYDGPDELVDLDALMVWDMDYVGLWDEPDIIIFSIRNTMALYPGGNFDGGEIIVKPWAGPAYFLHHDSHDWNTGFHVAGTFDLDPPTEEVDAIEAYPPPRYDTPTLTQWGLIILVGLIVASGVFITLRRRKAAVPA